MVESCDEVDIVAAGGMDLTWDREETMLLVSICWIERMETSFGSILGGLLVDKGREAVLIALGLVVLEESKGSAS